MCKREREILFLSILLFWHNSNLIPDLVWIFSQENINFIIKWHKWVTVYPFVQIAKEIYFSELFPHLAKLKEERNKEAQRWKKVGKAPFVFLLLSDPCHRYGLCDIHTPSIHPNCKFVLWRIVTGGTRTMEVRQMEASIRRRLCWRGRLLLLHGL